MQFTVQETRQKGVELMPVYFREEELISAILPTETGLIDRVKKLKPGQAFPMISDSSFRLFYHVGKNPEWKDILGYTRKVCREYTSQLGREISVVIPGVTDQDWPVEWYEALCNGIRWSQYAMKVPKEENTDKIESAVVITKETPAILAAIKNGVAMADVQIRVSDLVNAPSNRKTPEYLSDWALVSGEAYGYEVNVMDEEQMQEEGLFAVLEVGKASENKPRFIVAVYEPAEYKHTLGLVGKGITFDTGGISIKPSSNLHYMKCDMGGAAAVLGALEAIAKLQLSIRVVAVVPCAENSVGGNAFRPGDIINSHFGKTIEVIDTDAEGRLILADGISYINKHFKPDTLIDLATLTGSSVATLGYKAAALFTDNEKLYHQISAAGDLCGERVWPLPLWKEYEEDLHSDVADLRNYSGKPIAGAINAAKFLQVFTDDHPAWAHLDIAGVAFNESEFGKMKNATAYGVRLLVEVAKVLSTKG